MIDKCQRCGIEDDELRTLFMGCGYDMSELGLPFDPLQLGQYTLLVCKKCRSDWMHFIRLWFETPFLKAYTYEEEGSGIFVRDFGCNREISEEGFKKLYPDKEPVRVKDE